MSEVFLFLLVHQGPTFFLPQMLAETCDTAPWDMCPVSQRIRRKGTQGAGYSSSLADTLLQDGTSGAWACSSTSDACVRPKQCLVAPFLLQSSISTKPAHVLAECCWQCHSSKLGCPLELYVVLKVLGVPPITYPNSVSLGSKMW